MAAQDFTTVEISRSALIHQVRSFKKIIGESSLFPVIKSNAYGHGTAEVVSVLNRQAVVSGYMVVSLDEALLLSQMTTKPITVLSFLAARFVSS